MPTFGPRRSIYFGRWLVAADQLPEPACRPSPGPASDFAPFGGGMSLADRRAHWLFGALVRSTSPFFLRTRNGPLNGRDNGSWGAES